MFDLFYRRMRSWWQHDRIRISPQAGRLLRVEAGDIVSFHGQDFMISTRAVYEGAAGTTVHLSCEANAQSAAMELHISPQGDVTGIWWSDGNGRRRCDPWELEVWPRRRMV